MESKNNDPHGCPDTAIGDCEANCARCGRDMHPELQRLREQNRDLHGRLLDALVRHDELRVDHRAELERLRAIEQRARELRESRYVADQRAAIYILGEA